MPRRRRHSTFQSKKKDSETKVGNILNLEGGVGADFLGGGLSAGLAYYGTFKLTDDQFDSLLPSLLIRDKNRVRGLGPEVSLAIAAKRNCLRLRQGALSVGARGANDDRGRGMEHPGDVSDPPDPSAMNALGDAERFTGCRDWMPSTSGDQEVPAAAEAGVLQPRDWT